MRIGVTLCCGTRENNWPSVLEAAKTADANGLDTIGFWDHYHGDPEWGLICGWSTYGALALATQRVRLLPMVLDNTNYLPGVLAKESSMLALISGGRFELGIGAGDYPKEEEAWGLPFPDAATRVSRLEETVEVLRRVWTGEEVSFAGQHLQLNGAISQPVPAETPRVVVGAGSSRRMVRSALGYADEINVYDDPAIVEFARRAIDDAGGAIDLSSGTMWDGWPEDAEEQLARWQTSGATRVLIALWHPFKLLPRVVEFATRAGHT